MMFGKMLKKSRLIVSLIMFSVSALFVSWCTHLSMQALEEANREAEKRAKAE